MQCTESTVEQTESVDEMDDAGETVFKCFQYLSNVVSEKLRQASSQPGVAKLDWTEY